MSSFWQMGGYAVFIWPAYGIALGGLGAFFVLSWRRMRKLEAKVDALNAARKHGSVGLGG